MSSCLGIYIDNNIIKYAKVTKERDNIKVDAFGIKFYEKLNKAIDQIVEETYSQKIPISVNLSDEMYNYYQMYALLTKKDLQKAVDTEFESFCATKGYNPNVFETRYAVVDNQLDKDKLRIIHIADNKIELSKREQLFSDYHLSNISPMAMSIPNLAMIDNDESCLIVNIEDFTDIITILNGKIYNVQSLEFGSKEILDKINLKENSYSKSYEICKNTTIYTSDSRDLQNADDEGYLSDIMPTLTKILNEVKNIASTSTEPIKKIYLTGTASSINNIDLYFQEYLPEVDCEILRPYFIMNTGSINIKDYIEVNSAISLALMGLDEGITGMNFKRKTLADRIPSWLKVDINPDRTKKENKNMGGLLTWDLGQKLDKTERGLLRIAIIIILFIIIYSCFSGMLNSQMNKKESEADSSIAQTRRQIDTANKDDKKIKNKTNAYEDATQKIEDTNSNESKNAIPNLLNQIMSVIPEQVQLTSIENTSGKKVVINAQSSKYEQLGFFVAKLKNDVILNNVVSTAGQKEGGIVTIKIEGDLPY